MMAPPPALYMYTQSSLHSILACFSLSGAAALQSRIMWLFRVRQTVEAVRHAVGGDQTTSVFQDIHRHDAAGRALKVHMARVYSAGRGQKRESVQISAEGKQRVFSGGLSCCVVRGSRNYSRCHCLIFWRLLAQSLWRATRGKSWQRSRRTCSWSLIKQRHNFTFQQTKNKR